MAAGYPPSGAQLGIACGVEGHELLQSKFGSRASGAVEIATAGERPPGELIQARLDLLREEIEEQYLSDDKKYAAESDKAWDAMHRTLTDGRLG